MALVLGIDMSYVLPAVLFTLLAVILGSSFFKKPKPSKKKEEDAAPVECTEKVEDSQPKTELPDVEHKEEVKAEADEKKEAQKEAESAAVAPVVEEMGVVEEQPDTEPEARDTQEPEAAAEPETTPKPASEEEPIPELIPGDVEDTELETLGKLEPEDEPVDDDLTPKYSPGKKRTTQFEEMMTKEELEEEQSMEE